MRTPAHDQIGIGAVLPEKSVAVPPPQPASSGATVPRDSFLAMLLTMSMVERYVTDWTGPHTVIRGINVKLEAPARPGDTITFTGAVTAVTHRDLTIEVHGHLPAATHATATVRLSLG
ncbi:MULTISPECIES: MaoC/PaaZ C-terminal domain-containing protein [Spongiactinospora]|uniref:MaoC/PaaZ C-terminal domain-containing protein n=1 Tax=Spongiactinospora TaxID=2871671 RepID=UPI0013150106|nr:MaoC/PaaZ C-terminal domain-containing protein [Spongiactinospora gelatinilytica]